MDLSSELIAQFAKVTKNETKTKKESTVYGTAVESNGLMYVQIDGSDLLTPVDTTIEVNTDDRVMVLIKDHGAVITGNLSAPAVGTTGIFKGSLEIGELSQDGLLPAFKVANSGNVKIGGNTGQTIGGYERAQFEITSSGTLYSVSLTEAGVYTRITEGRVYVTNGENSTNINGNSISTYDIQTNTINNRSGDQVQITGGEFCTVLARSTSDAGYFHPSDNGETRNGTASYYWKILYAVDGVNTGSDRTIKENIKYLHNDSILSVDDCYNFINNDYLMATYNYINDKDKRLKLSGVAQDLLVNVDGTDNMIGQLIVDCEEAASENGILSINQPQLLNVTIGALQKVCKRLDELESRI